MVLPVEFQAVVCGDAAAQAKIRSIKDTQPSPRRNRALTFPKTIAVWTNRLEGIGRLAILG
jgi:hypothetical protein